MRTYSGTWLAQPPTYVATTICMLAFYLFLLAGCAASVRKIDTHKSAAYSQSFSRLMVVTNVTDPMGKAFADSLGTAMSIRLSAAGLESRVITLTGLELEDVNENVGAYGPDGMLVIKTAGGTVMDGNTIMNVVYDISVYENIDKKRVWRAKVDFMPGGFTMTPKKRAETLADQLIQILKKNELIH